MADVGEVRYRVSVDTSGINDDIKKTEQQLKKSGDIGKESFEKIGNETKKVGSEAEKASGKFGKMKTTLSTVGSVGVKALKGIGTAFISLTSAAAGGIAAVSKMGIEYNAQMQSYQTAFATMLGDAEKAQALTNELKDMAAATPLAMTDLADASKILLAFGSSAEELPNQLKRLGDVAQGDAEALGTMATAFGRVQSNGYASLEEINMMIDQGFNPLQIIAEQTGETMAEVRDRVSEGGVSFEELSNALQIATDQGGQFFNAMENQSQTFEGQISTLKDNVAAMTGEMTAGLFDSLANNALPMINGWVDQVTQAVQTGGVEGGVGAMGVILTEALTALLNGIPNVIETANTLIGSFLQTVSDNSPQITESAINVVLTLLRGFVSQIPNIISTATTLISNLIQGIANHFPEIMQLAIELVGNLISGLISSLPELIGSVGELAEAIIDGFLSIDWLDVGKSIINGIIKGIGSLGGALVDTVVGWGKKAWGGIKSFFGISSPSKLMRDTIGKPIIQGIETGVDQESPKAVKKAVDTSSAMVSAMTADVNYKIPNISSYAKSLTANFGGNYHANTAIIVPLYMDSREVARATAWYTGEQLSWEEM